MSRVRPVVCALLLLASCSTQSSPADKQASPTSGKSSGDPWSPPAKGDKDRDKNKDDGLGGFDLKSAMEKVSESISKPGPYEAPDRSKDFDETKPHWGVLKL